ncbi:hypothetical protein VTK56DRAFT_7559 [Thermocarpiscus australiensis]
MHSRNEIGWLNLMKGSGSLVPTDVFDRSGRESTDKCRVCVSRQATERLTHHCLGLILHFHATPSHLAHAEALCRMPSCFQAHRLGGVVDALCACDHLLPVIPSGRSAHPPQPQSHTCRLSLPFVLPCHKPVSCASQDRPGPAWLGFTGVMSALAGVVVSRCRYAGDND